MLLAVDVGNTHTRFTLLDSGEGRDHLKLATWPGRTPAELRGPLQGFLGPPGRVTAACVSSVVPGVDDSLARALGDIPIHFVRHSSALGFELDVELPAQVGADRLVNAAGALTLASPPLVLIDAGTAITVCALAPGPKFLGGAIAPGPAMAAAALARRTAKLPEIELKAPPAAAGRTTEEALQSGVVLGLAGLIEGLVMRMREQLGGEATVLATGGALVLFGDHLRGVDQVVPDLTTRGLAAIASNEGLV